MTPAQKLISYLREISSPVDPPANEQDILTAESELGYSLPRELREFYQLSRGSSYDSDSTFWEFFHIDQLESHSTYRSGLRSNPVCQGIGEIHRDSIVIFADVMIDAPSYWMIIDPDHKNYGAILCDADKPWWIAAKSYAEFIDHFIKDPDDFFIGIS